MGGGMTKMLLQFIMAYWLMQQMTDKKDPEDGSAVGPAAEDGELPATGAAAPAGEDGEARGMGAGATKANKGQMKNVYEMAEECQLWVHYGRSTKAPPLAVVLNDTAAAEEGFKLVWSPKVWYTDNATVLETNVSLGPLWAEALEGDSVPYLHATLVRTAALQAALGAAQDVPPSQVLQESMPLTIKLRELNAEAGAENLFQDSPQALADTAKNRAKVTYWKTKLQVRPVYDFQIHTASSLASGPFRRLKGHPELGVYTPHLYLSDFWLLEKEYTPLNETLAESPLNLTLSYETISLWKWSLQTQMADQWMQQSEWGLTDTQRDSFMLKRLILDTNPWILAFSGAFIAMHTLFSMLAFKNDIQFWAKNESMQGLSARSMVISWFCQVITGLYLLDSQETSRLLLFEIGLEAFLSTWKLQKAIKVELVASFPFIQIGGQKGYEENSTSKYDEQAMRYMGALLTPLFLGYCVRSALYGKHRGWYSFLISSAAGGVYTFGFVMMTPQLYINYKLKSVEHLPWRALTYKAMNTFVDDIAAFLIDMPMMHRVSCFRDDIIFFIYIYQRWAYRTDKSRPSMWVEGEAEKKEVADAASEKADDAAPSPKKKQSKKKD